MSSKDLHTETFELETAAALDDLAQTAAGRTGSISSDLATVDAALDSLAKSNPQLADDPAFQRARQRVADADSATVVEQRPQRLDRPGRDDLDADCGRRLPSVVRRTGVGRCGGRGGHGHMNRPPVTSATVPETGA